MGKSTFEKHKEFVSKTAPQLKLAGEPGETKLAVAEATIAEAQYRGVSRRRQFRGGNGTAEATVSRSIERPRGISVAAVGGRGGEYRGLHDPKLSCSHADPETLTSLRDRMSVPRQSGSYRGYEATWEEAVVIHIQQFFATKACDDSLE